MAIFLDDETRHPQKNALNAILMTLGFAAPWDANRGASSPFVAVLHSPFVAVHRGRRCRPPLRHVAQSLASPWVGDHSQDPGRGQLPISLARVGCPTPGFVHANVPDPGTVTGTAARPVLWPVWVVALPHLGKPTLEAGANIIKYPLSV
ncbi:hypothetical protein ACJZ2D_010281 [Fusarium nematophilum]